jgi:hypothetical protein
MWPLTSRVETALRQSHTFVLRATAYGAYGVRSIPINSTGSRTSDSSSQVRGQASIETDIGLWDVDPRSIISTTGTEIQVDFGIVLPGRGPVDARTTWIPQIRGVLAKASRERPIPAGGAMPLHLFDRSLRIAEDRLTAPTQTVSGALTTAEIRRLIQRTFGLSQTVRDLTGSTKVAPVLDIERDVWADGVEKLADSISAEVYADPVGDFVIRPQPQLGDNPVWVVNSGSGGILVRRGDEVSREQVYNGVVVRGERTDGTAPVTATVWDDDPASPTYYLGPFGRKPRFYSSPLLTSVQQCIDTGRALLARVKGAGATVALDAIVNPALESGDVVVVHDEGVRQTHMLGRVSVPFSPSSTQPLETRTLDLPQET